MPSASRPIIVGRLVIVGLAAAAVVWSFAPRHGGDRTTPRPPAVDAYACPMHPEVAAAAPGGHCPICRMSLERIPPPTPTPTAITAKAERRSFTRAARGGAWVTPDGDVEAVFANGDLVGLTPGRQGNFFRAAAPNAAVAVDLLSEPPRAWEASTAKVGFRPRPGVRAGDVGDTGWVVMAPTTREYLVIPSNAVLQSRAGPYVLMATERDGLRVRLIEIGKVLNGAAAVLSGLRDGEAVIGADAFFVDVERRLGEARRGGAEVIP